MLSHWATWEAPRQYVLISNHALKFHSIICQLYLKKAGEEKVLYLVTGLAYHKQMPTYRQENNMHRRKQFAYQAMKTAFQLEIQMFSLIDF